MLLSRLILVIRFFFIRPHNFKISNNTTKNLFDDVKFDDIAFCNERNLVNLSIF